MHISKLVRINRGVVSRVLAVTCLVGLGLGEFRSPAAAQSCGERPEPRDAASVSSPAQMPEVYLARINAGDAEHVTNLFANNAVHRGPDGQIREGRAAILAFYERTLGGGSRTLAVGQSVADTDRVVFELINVEPPCNEDDPALAVDIMEINDQGQIQDFTVFMRPRPQ